MERIKERLTIARTALSALQEAVGRNDLTDLERDGAIQRFEFTYEMVWKAVQAYLDEFEKVKISSPRGIVRASFETGVITEEQAQHLLRMADDRNSTVHTYDEKFAKALYLKLKDHADLMEFWLNEVSRRLSEQQ